MNTRRALVLAAHPDDEVLGCGGTVARLANSGCEVHIAILGEGASARHADAPDAAGVRALRDQAREAARVLGASGLEHFDFPDNRLDTVPLLDVVRVIETCIARHRPEVVYTQSGGDLNIDHTTLFRATLTATRPTPDSTIAAVYAYEVVSSTEWAFGAVGPAFQANTFVDITATLESKLAALDLYAGEVHAFPHPRSPEAVRAQAARWGSTVGVPAAEAFQLVRQRV